MLGSFSPLMRGGSQTPRSESARHSRTEESLQEHENYMEMTFSHSESSQSLRSERGERGERTVRTRGPSPNPYSVEALSNVYADSETATEGMTTPTVKRSNSKASAFLYSLIGRKSSSAGKTPIAPTSSTVTSDPTAAEGGTLPRSSRSMPPSPFSSLKRPKGSKKQRRSTTTAPPIAQSLSPVSPDVDAGPSAALFFHSHRSTSIARPSSARSPMTPPSPTTDFLRLQPAQQFSPPSANKPGCSQPISISFPQRMSLSSSSSYTPRGSPVTHLNLNLSDDYVLAQTSSRFSSSPSRFINMPTLSPLPEVLCQSQTGGPNKSKEAQLERSKVSASKAPGADTDTGYMNMDFVANNAGCSKFNFPQVSPAHRTSAASAPLTVQSTSNVEPSTMLFVGPPEPSQPVRIPLKATDAKENTVTKPTPHVVDQTNLVDSNPANVPTSNATSSVPAAAKQRANSLEKIVCAFNEKIKIGPKRHSSGDKPLKRPSGGGTLIFRFSSNFNLIRNCFVINLCFFFLSDQIVISRLHLPVVVWLWPEINRCLSFRY